MGNRTFARLSIKEQQQNQLQHLLPYLTTQNRGFSVDNIDKLMALPLIGR